LNNNERRLDAAFFLDMISCCILIYLSLQAGKSLAEWMSKAFFIIRF